MQNLSIIPPEKLVEIYELLPLKDLIEQNNAYIEPLIKYAIVLAVASGIKQPPVTYGQAED